MPFECRLAAGMPLECPRKWRVCAACPASLPQRHAADHRCYASPTWEAPELKDCRRGCRDGTPPLDASEPGALIPRLRTAHPSGHARGLVELVHPVHTTRRPGVTTRITSRTADGTSPTFTGGYIQGPRRGPDALRTIEKTADTSGPLSRFQGEDADMTNFTRQNARHPATASSS